MAKNEIALKILNMGKDGYKNDAEGFEKLKKANDLIDSHVTEKLRLYGGNVSLPTDPMELAEYLHDSYRTIAKRTKWDIQEECKVPFNELPNENKNTLIVLAGKIILDFVSVEE